jgi:hypothetical protein
MMMDDGSNAGDIGIQLAKSASSKGQVFTNCGKADDQETAAKRAEQKLTRVPFTVPPWLGPCVDGSGWKEFSSRKQQ